MLARAMNDSGTALNYVPRRLAFKRSATARCGEGTVC